MRKIAILLITCTVFSVNAQEGGGIESITPARTLIFMKSGQVKDFVKFARVFIDTLLPEANRQKVQTSITEFRQKTGIDLLNAASLSSAGIDIDRQMGLAWFGETQTGAGRIVLYIPSRGSRDLPMAMVELRKKLSAGKDVDVYPAVTDYRGSRILQVGKDLFMTVVSGYFIMASEGDLLHSVVDLSVSGGGSLANDAMYGDFRRRDSGSFDVVAYAGGDFIREMLRQQRQKEAKEKEGTESGSMRRSGNGMVMAVGEEQTPTVVDDEGGRWIDYGTMGLSMSGEKITASVSVKCNDRDRAVEALVQAMKPGPPVGAIASKEPSVYAVISLWPERVGEAFGGGDQLGKGYLGVRRKLQSQWGVDITRDVLPLSTGTMNLIMEKGQGLQPRTVVFLPMKTPKSGSILLDKIRGYQKSHLPADRFGELSLRGRRAIWSLDDKGKTFIAADDRGLYTGNDGGLVSRAIAAKSLGAGGRSPVSTVPRQEQMFLYLFIARDSIVRPLLMMGAAGLSKDGSLSQFIMKMGDMSVIGRRDGSFVTLDLDIGLSRGGR
ncbi:MAG: hypothetical protein JXA20_00035 [Spirochaetes bacterium]|nr:hypothetical protein [Spirochaetota bacterium]